MIEITLQNARPYLIENGYIPDTCIPTIKELGWGISNVVMMVTWDGDCFVMKQSLPKLRVADEWVFDRRRIFIERDCMAFLTDLLPEGRTPRVRFCDEENFVLGMSCAPSDGHLWKQALLDGHVDMEAAARAGQLLAQIHSLTSRHPETITRFSSQQTFIEGRVDPYHWTLAKAQPDLAPVIHAETDRLLATQRALVHGDFSPKNIFVYPDRLLLLDFEVAHFGDPAFDAGFCLTHLVLKATKFQARSSHYLDAAAIFWQEYVAGLTSELQLGIETTTISELGCILLARIDGKSKVEYITDEPTRRTVRQIGREILFQPETTVDATLDRVRDRLTAMVNE